LRSEPQTSTAATTKWHPATKLLLLGSLLVVPYLLWTRQDAGTGVAAPTARDAGTVAAAAAVAEPPPAALEPYALPPLERFAAVVERPLFSPTRRMPPLAEPAAEPQAEPESAPPPVAAPAGPEEPELRFFGTVRQGDRAAALVTFPATNAVARLAPGDRVGAWEVLEVERNRLVLGLGEERRSFQIFGPGAPTPAAAAAAPAAAPAAPEEAEALPPDEPYEPEPPPDESPPE
jgi:general secretion pathway protein N